MSKILIVDDEHNLRRSLADFLKMENFEVEEATNGLSAMEKLKESVFEALVLDLKMPGMDGLQLLDWLKQEGPELAVLMISAFGEIEDAVRALKMGADDYLVKPFDPEELLMRLNKVMEKQRLDRLLTYKAPVLTGIESLNPEMKKIQQTLVKAAPTDANILITGESGTGKEVLARQVHALSPRAQKSFVAVNVGGIPEGLLESELFGYEKGAFTGADRRKIGLIESAAGGSFFLDEIGEMPMALQVKLLRILQERKVQRLGGLQPLAVDIRLIAATNKDLPNLIKQGQFREDLYYRLNVIHLELPPLRKRKEDISVFLAHFINKFKKKRGIKAKKISPDLIDFLSSYSFPGNIRELENLVERALILSDGDSLRPADFPINISEKKETENSGHDGRLKSIEKAAIIKALYRNEGQREKTASELGITRRTLLNKLKEYGIQ